MSKTLFLFDLDGTLTEREILPELALALGIGEEMRLLTRLTLDGTLNFAQSLRLRFAMLRSLPLAEIHRIVENIPLEPQLEAFIRAHPEQCALATGNVDAWIAPIIQRLGCRAFSSESTYHKPETDGAIPPQAVRLTRILDKGDLARELKREHRLVAIGDSDNDLPMLRAADLSIAFGAAHPPLPQVKAAADYAPPDGATLRALLERIALLPDDAPLPGFAPGANPA